MLHWFLIIVGIITVVAIAIYAWIQYENAKEWNHNMQDLKDCPFKFHKEWTERSMYVVFEFAPDALLWCEYDFGIRSDGYYGIKDLKLIGINSYTRNVLRLNIGQSVFPIITKMAEFQEWARKKVFKVTWDYSLGEAWKEMKEELDNLRILEAKSKEAEENL